MHLRNQLTAAAIVFAALGSYAHTASAQDQGWYLGAGIGWLGYGDKGTVRYDESTFATREDTGGDDTSVSAWGGYRFNRYFSVELGYMRNDGTELVLRDEANEVAGRFHFRTQGATVTVVGTLPLGKWEPYTRLGAFYAETESRLIGVADPPPAASEHSVELIGALGLAYNFTQHWQAKLDGALLFDAGERTGTGATNVAVVTVGFTHRF